MARFNARIITRKLTESNGPGPFRRSGYFKMGECRPFIWWIL